MGERFKVDWLVPAPGCSFCGLKAIGKLTAHRRTFVRFITGRGPAVAYYCGDHLTHALARVKGVRW